MNRILIASITFIVCGLLAQAQPRPKQADVTAEITRLERQMWEHWQHHEYEEMKAQMTAEALFVSASAITNRDTEVAGMKKDACQVKNYTLADIKVSAPSPGVALIVYRSTADGTCAGTPLPATGDMNTSLWVKQGNRWLIAYHGQTPVPK